ncbi:MAG: phenylalanine 4-monooxygenase [Bacteroidota bacterium]
MRPTKQIYNHYTEQDFLVWETLFNRQMNILEPIVSSEYLRALKTVEFSSGKIPDFDEIATCLKPLTGWSIYVVSNVSPKKQFFECLSQKKFTSTCWLRNIEQLDYLEEPDMFHDVFGHIPLLSNQEYARFLKGLSDIALKHFNNKKMIELLGRIYWFTIEFGLLKEKDQLKIYGAGIISSAEETRHCLSVNAIHHPFDIGHIFGTDYRTDIVQEQYFLIESFEQLYHSLPDIELLLQQYAAKKILHIQL